MPEAGLNTFNATTMNLTPRQRHLMHSANACQLAGFPILGAAFARILRADLEREGHEHTAKLGQSWAFCDQFNRETTRKRNQPYGVLHPTREDRAAFSAVESDRQVF